jgi:aryl-alcohol dehydrogenase-like predicted oxidoreductase
MGTQTFGWGTDEAMAYSISDRFVEAGGNFFDTSNTYNKGKAEVMLGHWLKRQGNRSQMIVATKVFFPVGDGPNDSGLSRKHIFDQIDTSLRRLQTDYCKRQVEMHLARKTILHLLERTNGLILLFFLNSK